jgi:hypothetical protein
LLQIITWALAAIIAILSLLPAMLRSDKSKPAGIGAFLMGMCGIAAAAAIVLMVNAQVAS